MLVFILAGPLANQCLQSRQCVGPQRWMSAPLDGKLEGPIESRNLVQAQPFGLTFTEPHPRYRLPILDFVIEGCGVTSDVKAARQRFQPLPGRGVYQLVGLKDDPGALEISPARYRFQLFSDTVAKLIGGQPRHGASRSAPQLVQFHQRPAQSVLIGVDSFVVDESLSENVPNGRLELGRDFSLERFDFRLQVKPEVASAPLEGQPLMLSRAYQDHTRRTQRRVPTHQVV